MLGASTEVSSRKLQAGTSRGELGRASDTRRCFKLPWGLFIAVVIVDVVVVVPDDGVVVGKLVCVTLIVVGDIATVGG